MVALDPRWKNADPKQMLAHAVREQMDLKRDRYYQLDGDCYAVALEARKKQFPYYIDDVFYVSRFVACHEDGTGVAGFLPGSWDHLGCQSWDHPARLPGESRDSSFDRRVGVAVTEGQRAWDSGRST